MVNTINNLGPKWLNLLITLTAALLFVPFLGGVHLFDWDEINFAEAAREMIVTGDYLTVQVNYLPFWEKPPLFIWMQVISMQLFGVGEFAARFPNAVCGIITLLMVFNIGRRLRDNWFGLCWVMAFAGAVLPFLYFKSGIIDPWFNLFIFLGVYFLMGYADPESRSRTRNLAFSAFFAGLSVLTKGPVGFLLVALTGGVYLLTVGFRVKTSLKDIVAYLAILILVGGSWSIVQILSGHYDTFVSFIDYQIRLFKTRDAGHGGFPGYHFVVLLFGMFPSSVLAIGSFRKQADDEHKEALARRWMVILFWVVLVLFSLVKTKIVHYSSLAYFPLSYLAADFAWRLWHGKANWKKWHSITLIALSVVIAIPAVVIPFVNNFREKIIASNLIMDKFAVASLSAEVNWTGLEAMTGLFLVAGAVAIVFKLRGKRSVLRPLALWILTLVFTYTTLIVFVPRVEQYSQNAMITFLKTHAGKDAYLHNYGFKSYATYFYGHTLPPTNPQYYNEGWLLTGDIDKDLYMVTRIERMPDEGQFAGLEKTGAKNGFVFYRRQRVVKTE